MCTYCVWHVCLSTKHRWSVLLTEPHTSHAMLASRPEVICSHANEARNWLLSCNPWVCNGQLWEWCRWPAMQSHIKNWITSDCLLNSWMCLSVPCTNAQLSWLAWVCLGWTPVVLVINPKWHDMEIRQHVSGCSWRFCTRILGMQIPFFQVGW